MSATATSVRLRLWTPVIQNHVTILRQRSGAMRWTYRQDYGVQAPQTVVHRAARASVRALRAMSRPDTVVYPASLIRIRCYGQRWNNVVHYWTHRNQHVDRKVSLQPQMPPDVMSREDGGVAK
jgi:hypothetical protein